MCSLPQPLREGSRHPVDVGASSEAVILAELVRRGHTVLVPYGSNHRYDLVLEGPDGFVRVQCKTGRLRHGAILFPTRSTRANRREVLARGYQGEIDLFMVYCPQTEKVYAVPLSDAASSSGSLRVTSTSNSQQVGIRWAADYELPDVGR